mgnify:CR=1 FL=1
MGRHRSSLRDLGWGVSNSPNPWKQGSAKRVVRTLDYSNAEVDEQTIAPAEVPAGGSAGIRHTNCYFLLHLKGLHIERELPLLVFFRGTRATRLIDPSARTPSSTDPPLAPCAQRSCSRRRRLARGTLSRSTKLYTPLYNIVHNTCLFRNSRRHLLPRSRSRSHSRSRSRSVSPSYQALRARVGAHDGRSSRPRRP